MYTQTAAFYNEFIKDIDYDGMASFCADYISSTAPVLDCACGTGTLTVKLARRGYNMIGLDISEDMLEVAREAALEAGQDILWICQDMSKMDLFGTVSGVVCTTDSVNHIISDKKLMAFFKRARLFTEPGGVLIFDALTEHHFKSVGAAKIFYQDFEDCSCFWTGKYSAKTGICRYELSYFDLVDQRGAEGAPLYERFDDEVTEKYRSDSLLKKMALEAGYSSVEIFGSLLRGKPRATNTRHYFVCRV